MFELIERSGRQIQMGRSKWRNYWTVAECELSCLTRQCLAGRRIGELTTLQSEIKVWADKTNAKQRGVDWQFKVNLKRLHPVFKSG